MTAKEMLDLVDDETLQEACNLRLFEKALLYGADDLTQYVEGGCSLFYDTDIAKRYCTPSELKRTNNGEKDPNSYETWLDISFKGVCQAYGRLLGAYIALYREK